MTNLRYYSIRACAAVFGMLTIGQAVAQDVANGKTITSDQADAILKELKGIREIISRAVAGINQPAPLVNPSIPTKVKLNLEGLPGIGSEKAPVIVVEFSDYQCPFCRDFEQNTFPKIKEAFVDTGRVRLVSVDLPLQIHRDARSAANVALCAKDQGKFWETRAWLLSKSPNLGPEGLASLALATGLDLPPLQSCVADGKHMVNIGGEEKMASDLGISSTPTFIIGKLKTDGVDGVLVVGAHPYAVFEAAIKAAESAN